jgi:hypothetical protein
MQVDAARVLAFRLAGHGLAAPDPDPAAALARWSVQDSPPGAAAAALAARVEDLQPGWLDAALADRRAVALYNARTATAVVPAEDAAAYGTAQLPPDEAGLKAIVGQSLPGRRTGFAAAVELAVTAVSEALDGRVLSRDDLHEELRGRLPMELLPWCRGCGSHHAKRGLLVMASLHGRLCIAGRAGRQPAFARTDRWVGWEPPDRADAGAELVRRYLSAYGPSTPAHLAAWTGIAPAHARALWATVDGELAEVAVDGARAWVLAADLPRLEDPPPAPGVRLIAAGDPFLLGRDREALIPDADLRARIWRAIGGPGLVLVDGEPAALWSARKAGRVLRATVEPFAPLPDDAVAAAFARLATHRGCAETEVEEAPARGA